MNASADVDMTIEDFVRMRGISRLVHFTPLNNLLGIYEIGALWAKSKIESYAKEHNDCFLLDYIRWNDGLRLDGRCDCINMSVQRINHALFDRFRKKFAQCDVWCVLEFPPTLLERDGVVFTIGNAASSYVRAHGSGCGIKALKAMFADPVVVGNCYGTTMSTRGGVPKNCPTNRQAEVMIPGAISCSEVSGIVFANEEHACRAARALHVAYPGLDLPPIRVCPADFE